MGLHAVLGEVILRNLYDFRGDHFAFQVAWLADCAVLRHGQDPAHARKTLLGINQFRKFFYICARLHHPIVPRDSRVQGAGFDVARHFLCAHHQTFDFRVVNGRDVTARTQCDFPAGARKKIKGRVLKAAFRNPQLQSAHRDFSLP